MRRGGAGKNKFWKLGRWITEKMVAEKRRGGREVSFFPKTKRGGAGRNLSRGKEFGPVGFRGGCRIKEERPPNGRGTGSLKKLFWGGRSTTREQKKERGSQPQRRMARGARGAGGPGKNDKRGGKTCGPTKRVI